MQANSQTNFIAPVRNQPTRLWKIRTNLNDWFKSNEGKGSGVFPQIKNRLQKLYDFVNLKDFKTICDKFEVDLGNDTLKLTSKL